MLIFSGSRIGYNEGFIEVFKWLSVHSDNASATHPSSICYGICLKKIVYYGIPLTTLIQGGCDAPKG
jgi:hypothetical protein